MQDKQLATAQDLLDFLLHMNSQGSDLETIPVAFCETVVKHKGTEHFLTAAQLQHIGFKSTRSLVDRFNVTTTIESDNVLLIGVLPLID